jgi:hypothetical protein
MLMYRLDTSKIGLPRINLLDNVAIEFEITLLDTLHDIQTVTS